MRRSSCSRAVLLGLYGLTFLASSARGLTRGLGPRLGRGPGWEVRGRSRPRGGIPWSSTAFSTGIPCESSLVLRAKASADEPVEGAGDIQWGLAAGSFAAAAAFAAGLYATQSAEAAIQFSTGFLLEQSLSVDNLFVFLLIFDYFKVPPMQQKKVLNWGIWGAAIMRGVLITVGQFAITKFRAVFLVFAGILLFSSYKILAGVDDDEEEDLSENGVVKLAKRLFPSTDQYDGDNFFTTGPDGARLATPLLVVLACIEISDVVFAVDSVPAIFGITEDPFIVFTSNMFAIAGLRSIYSVLSVAVEELEYLMPAVGAVLGFIGIKLILGYLDIDIGDLESLEVVLGLLGTGIASSLVSKRKTEAAEKG